MRRSRVPPISLRPACASFGTTAATALALATLVVGGCGGDATEPSTTRGSDRGTSLTARPGGSSRKSCPPGEHELRISSGRRALMQVTRPGRRRERAVLLALHGAGSGGAPGGLWAFRGAWDVPGLVIVAPAARGTTWTLGREDVRFIDRSLKLAFARCPVDRQRVGIGGFSAGAGLALWLGLTNGDLFRGVIALSGGGSLPRQREGRPEIFLAHGTSDNVIPIAYGGDRVAAELRADGYEVTYRRFAGGHRVLPTIARAAVREILFE